jgi:hypothetical protein
MKIIGTLSFVLRDWNGEHDNVDEVVAALMLKAIMGRRGQRRLLAGFIWEFRGAAHE